LVPAIQKYGDEKIKRELEAWLEITPPLDMAGFSKAFGRREQLQREWLIFMQNYPIIVTPCSWKKQFPIDLDQQGPSAMRDILKAQSPMLAVALMGLPGLAVPTGIVDDLPTGVQVIAGKFREDLCFDAGEVIESAVEPGTPLNPRT
jgi:amidase